MSVSLAKFVALEPMARGEDVVIDLTGPTDATGWTLQVKCGYSQVGPPIPSSDVTAVYLGGDDFTIRVTMPASFTSGLTIDSDTGWGKLYVELWRTDAGETRPLRRMAIEYYDSVTA